MTEIIFACIMCLNYDYKCRSSVFRAEKHNTERKRDPTEMGAGEGGTNKSVLGFMIKIIWR